jgi:hypothetical protein
LREKKSAMAAQGYHQPVPTNLDLLGFNRREGRKDAERHPQPACLVKTHRKKSRVLRCCGKRGLGHGAVHREHRQNIANAAAQLTFEVDGRERASWLRQVSARRIERQSSLLKF